MPWVVVDGQTVKIGNTPRVEVTREIVLDDFTCPECGKEYKTERGFENHLTTH